MTTDPRPDAARPDTTALDRAHYVSLTTFRKDGTPVATPVWIVRHGDGWACTTGADSWKVKRLCRDDRIEVAPSDARGRVAADAPRFRGRGRVVEDEAEYGTVRAAVARKYRLMSPLLAVWSRIGRLFGRHDAEGAVAWLVEGTVDGPTGPR